MQNAERRGTDEINDAITSIEKTITDVQSRLDEISKVQDEIDKVQRISDYFKQKWYQIKSLLRRFKVKYQNLKKNKLETTMYKKILTLNEDALDILHTKKENLVQQKHYYDIAVTLLRDQGVRQKIIKQYVPIMNKLINKYLAQLEFYVGFELNESFEETIKSRFKDVFKYDNFSQGEKMRIDLSLLFTWRGVARMKNSVNTNLLILDEVFDSSLDTNGTDDFLKLLNTLTEKTNAFIISHKGDVLYDKFEDVIRFEKHKNFSRIAE